jgi:hypothetical protein
MTNHQSSIRQTTTGRKSQKVLLNNKILEVYQTDLEISKHCKAQSNLLVIFSGSQANKLGIFKSHP